VLGWDHGSEEGGEDRETCDAELTQLQDAEFGRSIAVEGKGIRHIENDRCDAYGGVVRGILELRITTGCHWHDYPSLMRGLDVRRQPTCRFQIWQLLMMSSYCALFTEFTVGYGAWNPSRDAACVLWRVRRPMIASTRSFGGVTNSGDACQ